MKIFTIYFLLIWILNSYCIGEELHGEIVISSQTSHIVEGDLIEGTLKVWPIENPDFNEFKKLENTSLFNTLDLIQIQNAEISVNNADLVEIKCLFVAKISGEMGLSQINYKGQGIVIKEPSIKIFPLKTKSKEFYILNQGEAKDFVPKIIVLAFFIAVGILTLWKREKIKNFFGKKNRSTRSILFQKYKIIFLNASSREDFEEIYQKRNEWVEFIQESDRSCDDFFKSINQFQYKKSWDNEELEKVRMSFDSIRGSFK